MSDGGPSSTFDIQIDRWHGFVMKRLIWNAAFVWATAVSWASAPVPDFQLTDVNPNSERRGSPVSPRDYVEQVSGFYFGHAG